MRFNVIAPGPIPTEGAMGRLSSATIEETAAIAAQGVPLGRCGAPEELANLAAFICSDYGSWFNGSVSCSFFSVSPDSQEGWIPAEFDAKKRDHENFGFPKASVYQLLVILCNLSLPFFRSLISMVVNNSVDREVPLVEPIIMKLPLMAGMKLKMLFVEEPEKTNLNFNLYFYQGFLFNQSINHHIFPNVYK